MIDVSSIKVDVSKGTESLETNRLIYKQTGKLLDYLTKLHKKRLKYLQTDKVTHWLTDRLED